MGQSVSITDTIDNQSATAASPDWIDSFYLSTEPAISSSAVHESGYLGMGQSILFDAAASTDSSGDIIIDDQGVVLFFLKQSDGSFLNLAGNGDTVSENGSVPFSSRTSSAQRWHSCRAARSITSRTEMAIL